MEMGCLSRCCSFSKRHLQLQNVLVHYISLWQLALGEFLKLPNWTIFCYRVDFHSSSCRNYYFVQSFK